MIRNLFDDLPKSADQEALADLVKRPGMRIERIVSTGQASPPGFWYDQAQGEWVAVLAGEARLRFEDEPAARTLRAGDFVDNAAGGIGSSGRIRPRRRSGSRCTTADAPAVMSPSA
jgi:cupin 2 domain-containing protein